MRVAASLLVLCGTLVVAAAACGGDDSTSSSGTPGTDSGPLFPADYASTYTEVRNCRQSSEHDLNHVRVLADPAALEPYQGRTKPFPVGAVVLKEEYDFGDADCSGTIKQWTVMGKLAEGSSATTLDWRWQQVDADRNVVSHDAARCYSCHAGCTSDTNGYDHTCEVP